MERYTLCKSYHVKITHRATHHPSKYLNLNLSIFNFQPQIIYLTKTKPWIEHLSIPPKPLPSFLGSFPSASWPSNHTIHGKVFRTPPASFPFRRRGRPGTLRKHVGETLLGHPTDSLSPRWEMGGWMSIFSPGGSVKVKCPHGMG